MKSALLLVLALAVLVPSFSEGASLSRCGLKNQLANRAMLQKMKEKMKSLATVICELERVANTPVLPPTKAPTMAPNSSASPATNRSPTAFSPSSNATISSNATTSTISSNSTMSTISSNATTATISSNSTMSTISSNATTSTISSNSTMSTNFTAVARRKREARGKKGPQPKESKESNEDSSAEKNGHRGKNLDDNIRTCLGAVNGEVTVDVNCIKTIYQMIWNKAGSECRRVSPAEFFKGCSN